MAAASSTINAAVWQQPIAPVSPRGARKAGRAGLLRGFGFANYLESNGGLLVASFIEPDRLMAESASLHFGSDSTLDIVIGTQSTGQDHALPLVRYAAASFGLAPNKIIVRQGDTEILGRGGGTGGSKSLLTSSVALERAVIEVAAKGRALLAREWNVDESAVEFAAGLFGQAGSNLRMSVAEIAARFPGALDGEYRGVLEHGSCANGCHACEIQIDPDTGEVRPAALYGGGRFRRSAERAGRP